MKKTINRLTPNIKIPSKNSRQAALRGGI
jgi:hypothetical protein